MSSHKKLDLSALNRRTLLAGAAGLAGAAAFGRSAFAQDPDAIAKTGVNPDEWNIETINALAGTITVDTAAELHALVPPDTATGDLSYWNAGPVESSPHITKQYYEEFQDRFKGCYPNINLDNQNVTYETLLDKLRTAAAGGGAPDVAKMPILWGVEFAGRGELQEIVLEDYNLSKDLFWEGALKSVTWEGKYYGIPTNNETMAFIWNKSLFAEAGLDPENPPATWADVVAYSKQIKDTTGAFGYGMVAKVNAGNTPFRFMPMVWAYGSSALDEAESAPTMKTTMINNEGGVAALQNFYDMYVRDKSVPTSALTNIQTDNQDLFISGQLAMMISHPSEYVVDAEQTGVGHGRRGGRGADGRREHGLWLDSGRSGAPLGRVRRFERPHLHRRRARWNGQCERRKGARRRVDLAGVGAQEQLDRFQPGQPARVRDGVDGAAAPGDSLPRSHYRHAPVWRSVPGRA